MKKRGVALLLGLIVIVGGWWILRGESLAQPQEGVVDVWATWGDDRVHLQALLDRFSPSSGVPVRVTTRVRSDEVLEALAGTGQPDMVILSAADLVGSYHEQELVEPLDGWIRATGIDLEDMYLAPLEQCQSRDGAYLCLPWGCDVDALFWNKDLFAAAGLDPERPPQTMEEMLEYANKLTVRDEKGKLGQVGFVPGYPRSHADLYVRMFGGAPGAGGAELTVDSQPVVDALDWQTRFYNTYGPEELEEYVSSFTPYMSSSHPVYAGRRMSCRQCHRAVPIRNKRIPDKGFYEGRIAMMVDGQWQVSRDPLAQPQPAVGYGLAPFPAPAAHPERASTAVVQGPVVIIPAGATDKEAATQLLAWMMSPEILAETAYAHAMLPASRTAAEDPRFRQFASLELLLDLLAHPNAAPGFGVALSTEPGDLEAASRR